MNYFANMNWEFMKSRYSTKDKNRHFSVRDYHDILCPPSEKPDFLQKYLELSVLKRLEGISLLCGTDWTKLYNNRMRYSRLDHSIGVALIVWHFTKDKAQTIAGLLHDIATPVFSHVSDFRHGDALTQESTEAPTSQIIKNDKKLQKLLHADGLSTEFVENYHKYPIADNEIPRLSADRLEYMFPSGASLDGCWTFEEIKKCYENILVLQNENGFPELGFDNVETAELYCEKFCSIGYILQLNENKLTLQLLGEIMNMAVKLNVLQEKDFMTLSEKQAIDRIENWISTERLTLKPKSEYSDKLHPEDLKIRFTKYYLTFRNMEKIYHTEQKLPENQFFSVSLKVKQRFINPLVKISDSPTLAHKNVISSAKSVQKAARLSDISPASSKIIEDFKSFSDTKFGCVKLYF